MQIVDIIWLPQVLDKLDWKHHVTSEEVEEVLFDSPIYRKVQKGHIPGENLYAAPLLLPSRIHFYNCHCIVAIILYGT